MKSKQPTTTTPPLHEQLGYLKDPQVAAFLGVEVPTLKNRRSRGDAPASSKVGAEHLTKVADLHLYVARKRSGGSSHRGAA